MALIASSQLLDLREIAKRIKTWLEAKGFETSAFEANDSYIIKARKASKVRSVFGADRALEVGVRHFSGQTQVDVHQGSWKTNIVSNAAWLLVTGGANLLISGWSVVIQKDLEAFIKSILGELEGVHRIDL